MCAVRIGGTYGKIGLHMLRDSLSGSYIGIDVWACTVLVVCRTIIHHVRVVQILQCILHSAVADGRRYAIPSAFKLTDTGHRRDLRSITH
jgi:hypothetical protein